MTALQNGLKRHYQGTGGTPSPGHLCLASPGAPPPAWGPGPHVSHQVCQPLPQRHHSRAQTSLSGLLTRMRPDLPPSTDRAAHPSSAPWHTPSTDGLAAGLHSCSPGPAAALPRWHCRALARGNAISLHPRHIWESQNICVRVAESWWQELGSCSSIRTWFGSGGSEQAVLCEGHSALPVPAWPLPPPPPAASPTEIWLNAGTRALLGTPLLCGTCSPAPQPLASHQRGLVRRHGVSCHGSLACRTTTARLTQPRLQAAHGSTKVFRKACCCCS